MKISKLENHSFYRSIEGADEYHLYKNCKKIKNYSFSIDVKSATCLFSLCEACEKQKSEENKAEAINKAKLLRGILENKTDSDLKPRYNQDRRNNNGSVEFPNTGFSYSFDGNKKVNKNGESDLTEYNLDKIIKFTSNPKFNKLNNLNENEKIQPNNSNEFHKDLNTNLRFNGYRDQNLNECSSRVPNGIQKLISELVEKKFDDLTKNNHFEEKVKLINNPLLNTVNDVNIRLMQIEDKLSLMEIEQLKRKELDLYMISFESLTDDLKMLNTKVDSVSERCFANEKLFDSIDFKFMELEHKIINKISNGESELNLKELRKRLLDLERKVNENHTDAIVRDKLVKDSYDFFSEKREKTVEDKLFKIESILDFQHALNKMNNEKFNALYDSLDAFDNKLRNNKEFHLGSSTYSDCNYYFSSDNIKKIKSELCYEIKSYMKQINAKIKEFQAFKHDTTIILRGYEARSQFQMENDSFNNEDQKEECNSQNKEENKSEDNKHNKNKSDNWKRTVFIFQHLIQCIKNKEKCGVPENRLSKKINEIRCSKSALKIKKSKLSRPEFISNLNKDIFIKIFFYNYKLLPLFLTAISKNVSDSRRLYYFRKINRNKHKSDKLALK